MSLDERCFLNRAAVLDTLMSIFEQKVSGQRLGSGPSKVEVAI